jgi:hypothetical protein
VYPVEFASEAGFPDVAVEGSNAEPNSSTPASILF